VPRLLHGAGKIQQKQSEAAWAPSSRLPAL
jgi:hypothetical protein